MIGNIYINGEIGTDVTLMSIASQVKAMPEATAYKVHINSPGGYVDAGFDILSYLRSLGKPIETYGSGMVASIATVIFMAGSTRSIAPNTEFMIHLPWTEGIGNADELERQVKELRAVEKQLLDFYKKELGQTEELLSPLLRDETWLTQDQLLTLGFTTSQPAPVLAKAYLSKPQNSNNKNPMTQEEKLLDKIEKGFAKILAMFGKAKAKLVQDATGVELDFPELADGDPIEVGAMATVDGVPAEGEYTMPDGSVYVFAAGALTEIRPADEPDQTAAMQAQIAELTAQLAEANAKKAEVETAMSAQVEALAKEVNEFKAQIKSSFNVDGKKETNKDDEKSKSAYAQFRERAKNTTR